MLYRKAICLCYKYGKEVISLSYTHEGVKIFGGFSKPKKSELSICLVVSSAIILDPNQA